MVSKEGIEYYFPGYRESLTGDTQMGELKRNLAPKTKELAVKLEWSFLAHKSRINVQESALKLARHEFKNKSLDISRIKADSQQLSTTFNY